MLDTAFSLDGGVIIIISIFQMCFGEVLLLANTTQLVSDGARMSTQAL